MFALNGKPCIICGTKTIHTVDEICVCNTCEKAIVEDIKEEN